MAPGGIGDSVEGIHAVAAAAVAGRITTLHVERSRADAPEIVAIIYSVEVAGGQVSYVDDLGPLAATSAPQGLVAETSPLPTVGLSDLAESERTPAVIVLDHLEDPRNLGAIARSAHAAGFTGMVVASRRASPLSATAFKTAAGALEQLSVCVVSSIPKALQGLQRRGLWIVGLDATASQSIFGLELLTEPLALVVGAEGSGLSRLTLDVVDAVAKIPMVSEVESLNASAASSLACFEVARTRGWVT